MITSLTVHVSQNSGRYVKVACGKVRALHMHGPEFICQSGLKIFFYNFVVFMYLKD